MRKSWFKVPQHWIQGGGHPDTSSVGIAPTIITSIKTIGEVRENLGFLFGEGQIWTIWDIPHLNSFKCGIAHSPL